MIACCPTHVRPRSLLSLRRLKGTDVPFPMLSPMNGQPPEVVVAPAAPEHREQFERFAEYLSDRKRVRRTRLCAVDPL